MGISSAQAVDLDVSGRAGADGQNGAPGKDATWGVAGEAGGSVYLELRPLFSKGTPVEGGLESSGTIVSADRKVLQSNKVYQLGKDNKLNIRAVGGAGGNGADGGHGEPGGKGKSAGRGGAASSGIDGGSGGNIVIRVQAKHLPWLMLLGETDVKGGEGGRPGQPGLGGEAGPDGLQGPDSVVPVQAGKPGPNGRVLFQVISPNGTLESDSRYELELLDFEVHDEDNDGKFYPGEQGTLSNMRIKNTGGLPTPDNFPVTLALPESEWVKTKGGEIVIEGSIKPGEVFIQPGTFHFHVRPLKEEELDVNLGFIREDIRPVALQGGVNRVYEKFSLKKDLNIGFPVEISSVVTNETLFPGSRNRILLTVKNSIDPSRTAVLHRPSHVGLRLTSQGDESAYVFLNAQGQKVPLEKAFGEAIGKLDPGEEVTVEAWIQVAKEIPAGTKIDFQTELLLTNDSGQQTPKIAQRQKISLTVGQVYRRTPYSGILLLINDQTKPEEVAEWSKLFESMGIKYDVWDTTECGLTAFFETLVHHTPGRKRSLRNMTVVVLNNEIPTAALKNEAPTAALKNEAPTSTQADALLPRKDLVFSAMKRNVKFYFVGKNLEHYRNLFAFYMLPDQSEASRSFTDPEEALRALNVRSTRNGPLATYVVQKSRSFGVRPTPEKFNDIAHEFQKQLEKRYPDRRFYVVKDYRGSLQSWTTWTNTYLDGYLTVHQSLPATQSSLIGKEVKGSGVDFVNSEENKRALVMSLGIPQRAYFLAQQLKVNPDSDWVQFAVDAFLKDFSDEQSWLRSKDFNSESDEKLKEQMPVLASMIQSLNFGMIFKRTDKEEKVQKSAQRLIDLFSRMKAMNEVESLWSEQGPVGKIEDITAESIEAYVEKGFGRARHLFDSDTWFSAPVSSEENLEYKTVQDLFGASVKVFRRQYESQTLEEILVSVDAVRDTDVSQSRGVRVIDRRDESLIKAQVLDEQSLSRYNRERAQLKKAHRVEKEFNGNLLEEAPPQESTGTAILFPTDEQGAPINLSPKEKKDLKTLEPLYDQGGEDSWISDLPGR